LEEEGWTVLRFWDFEIERDIGSCVAVVEGAVGQPPPALGVADALNRDGYLLDLQRARSSDGVDVRDP
jgi:hypothetical protein